MTIQAIYKKAVNNGYNAKTVQYNSGKYAVIIDGFNTVDFVNSIMQIYKRSNVHIDFNDDKKSVNYIFISGNERRVIYTQNGIIKAIDIA